MAIAGMDVFDLDGSSSNSDEDEKRRIRNFSEVIVPSFDDDEFRRHFRVQRETYELLVNFTGRRVSSDVSRPNVDVHKQLLMTLWMSATPDSYW